jgi:hypothetical protein
MRGAGTDWAGIAEAAMTLQFYSLCWQAAADSWKNRLLSLPRLRADLAHLQIILKLFQ